MNKDTVKEDTVNEDTVSEGTATLINIVSRMMKQIDRISIAFVPS